jgi:NhaP-type Na+/H+ or K+/H+ antiporter
VLAVVSGGLYMSSKRLYFLNSASRVKGFSVWESFVFILNGIVFLIIGLQLPEIEEGLRAQGIPISKAIAYGVLTTAVLIIARIISSYVAMLATYVFRRRVISTLGSRRRVLLMPLLLGWTGMRGVVSLAAALAIPITLDDGTLFPQRTLILFITFVTILLTLLLQGLTLPYFVRRSRLFEDPPGAKSQESINQKIRLGLKQHKYEFLKNKYENELNGHAGIEKFIKHWEAWSKTDYAGSSNEKTKAIFVELLESQRKYLVEVNKDPDIDEEIIRQQLYQIDLEEERLKIIID